jgi:hypothetical protein
MSKSVIPFSIFVAVATLILCSCEPLPEDAFIRTFTIAKDEHYSTPRLAEVLQSNRLVFTAKFDQSAMYDFGDAALQTNKNKLLGFADCNSAHHQNSARFAWQWMDGRLEIFAYCYTNSVRVEEFVGYVNLDETNRYEIEMTESSYIFFLNGEQRAHITRTQERCTTGVYYLLYPYFGGSVAAPHDVWIDIEVLR